MYGDAIHYGGKMSGYRSKEFYIKKYGLVEGENRYKMLLETRENRKRMRSSSKGKIKCLLCGKYFKRITRTHLKNKCIESISTEEYQRRFPDAILISDDLKKLYSNTKDSIKDKWGEDVGENRWNNYIKLQSESNLYEYKLKKYGWSKQKFNDYNKQRATTLDNLIIRYGEEQGLTKWKEYCDRQKYTTTLSYFIEKYGTEDGLKKYNKFVENRSFAKKTQSKIELEVFDVLKNVINNIELSVRLDNPYYGPFDYGSIEKRKLIEFYGTYWHADPRFFDSSKFFNQKKMTAKKIWARDQAKRSYATNQGYQVFVIWEHDWCKNKEKTVNNIIRWWND